MQISTNGANLLTSNYLKNFIQSEYSNNTNTNTNTNTNLKTSKMQENINFNMNNINNGNNSTTNQTSNNMNFNSVVLKSVNPQDKKIIQNKINNQNIQTIGINNLKSLDSSNRTISTKNINGKKFVFNEKTEKNEGLKNPNNVLNSNGMNEEKSNNLNRFSKIGKDTKIVTKQNDKIKNIFSSKIAEN